MANPKYQNLAYIASEEPDVYETEDLPESDQAIVEDDHDKIVERLLVDPKDAFKRFNKATIDNNGSDFSDAVGKNKRNSGFAVHYEVLGTAEQDEETILQKLQRLKCEMKEIEIAATSQFKEPDVNPTAVLSEIEKLQTQLLQFSGFPSESNVSQSENSSHSRLLTQLKSTPVKKSSGVAKKTTDAGDNVSYELHYKPEVTEAAKLSSLEARINKLENVIGARSDTLSTLSESTNGLSLMDAVTVLSSKAELLDEDKVDRLTARLQLLLQSVSKLEEGKGAEAQGLENVNELYELVKKWDASLNALPQIVDRLYALQDLHQQAMEFSSSLKALKTAQDALSQNLSSHNDLLESVKNTFASNVDIINSNVTALEKRINALKK